MTGDKLEAREPATDYGVTVATWYRDEAEGVDILDAGGLQSIEALLRREVEAAVARERELIDQQWRDQMHALCDVAGSLEINGFGLALNVRMAAIRAGGPA